MGFKIRNFTGDPFAIATVSFGLIAWIVALAGAAASSQGSFPHFTWWGIAYQIVIILVITVLYLNNNIELYKFTLVGLVSIGFIYTTNSTNNLVYNSSSSGNLCCAAGCILLSILNLIWILYFGGHPESPTNQFIDSFSSNKYANEYIGRSSVLKTEPFDDQHGFNSAASKRFTSTGISLPQENVSQMSQTNTHSQQQQQQQHSTSAANASNATSYFPLTQLHGLENSSQDMMGSAPRDLTQNTNTNSSGTKRNTLYTDSEGGTGITFRYKAKALYSYDANPDDINEISFIKDEILDVDDVDGKWWQARRANGQVGICPSNYVKLIDT